MAGAQAAPKSHTFAWQGLDRRGNKASGEITGTNIAMAKAMLRKQGINPKKGTKESATDYAFQAKD